MTFEDEDDTSVINTVFFSSGAEDVNRDVLIDHGVCIVEESINRGFDVIIRWFSSFIDYRTAKTAFYDYDYQQFNELMNYHIMKTIVLFVVMVIAIVMIVVSLRKKKLR